LSFAGEETRYFFTIILMNRTLLVVLYACEIPSPMARIFFEKNRLGNRAGLP